MEEIKDQDEIYQLLNKFDSLFSPSLSENTIDLAQYSKKLMSNAATYIAKENDEVTGFISFYVDDEELNYAYITLLAVLPEYQGRKIAQALLDRCIEEALAMNKKEIKLEVKNNNFPAISFYKKNNFKVVEEASDNNVYMKREL